MSSNSLLDPPRKRNLGAGTRLEPLRPKQPGGSRTGSSSAGPRPNFASSTGALRARVAGTSGPTTTTTQPTGGRRPSSADMAGVDGAHGTHSTETAKRLPANARHAGTTATTKSQPRAPATKRPQLSPAATASIGAGKDASAATRSRSGTQGHRASLSQNNHAAPSPTAGKAGRRGSSPKAATGSAFFTGAATAKRRGSATNQASHAATAGGAARGTGVVDTAHTSHGRVSDSASPAELEGRRRLSTAVPVVGSTQQASASAMQQAAAVSRARSRSTGGGGPSLSGMPTVRVGGALPSAAYDGTVQYCSQKKFWRTDLPETVLNILDGDALEPPFLTHLWKQAYDDPGAISEDADSYVDFYGFDTDAAYRAAVDAQRRHSVQTLKTANNNNNNTNSDPRVNPHLHSCDSRILNGFYACVRCHMPVVSPVHQVVNSTARGIAAFSHLNTQAVEVQLSSEALITALRRSAAEGSGGPGAHAHKAHRPSILTAPLPADTGASGTAAGLVFLVKCRACGGCLGLLSQDVPPSMVKDVTGGEVFYANSACLEYMAVDMRQVRFDGTITGEMEAADARQRAHEQADDEADELAAISRDVDAWFDDDNDNYDADRRASPSSVDEYDGADEEGL